MMGGKNAENVNVDWLMNDPMLNYIYQIVSLFHFEILSCKKKTELAKIGTRIEIEK